MNIDRVTIAVDGNKDYYQFWPFVARRWSSWGVRPTLMVISEKKLDIDESLGDVKYIKPIADIPTKHQAQIIRFFAAASFPDDVCITSDIDMMHLNKEYFLGSVKNYDDDKIVIYSADAYPPGNFMYPAYPIGYNAAKGSTFREIIKGDLSTFSEDVKEWMSHGYEWYTDEKVFYIRLEEWQKQNKNRTVLLNRGFNISNSSLVIRRIDRDSNCQYNEDMLRNNFYIDFHMPRPYENYKDIIDNIYNKTSFGENNE